MHKVATEMKQTAQNPSLESLTVATEGVLVGGFSFKVETMMTTAAKQFTDADVQTTGDYSRIYCDRSELIVDQPDWMQHGLTETASGYGKRLNSGLKINFNGKLYRIYITQFSNAGTAWFTVKGRRIIVS
jgi:hypothetical protein